LERIVKPVVTLEFDVGATLKDELLPIEVNRFVENLPVIDSVFE
jgi:hypothetical protein